MHLLLFGYHQNTTHTDLHTHRGLSQDEKIFLGFNIHSVLKVFRGRHVPV